MMERVRGIIRYHPGLWLALALAALGKAALLAAEVVPFNADEAVVALMARHILQGARPVFFYGQAYLGSTDAWLVGAAFNIIGQKVLAIRLVQGLLYLGVITATYLLGLRWFGRRWPAAMAALWLAIPPVFVSLYTTASLGGYGETLLIGTILTLWALRLSERRRPLTEWLAFGLLAGFGFYTFGLLSAYLLPLGVFLLPATLQAPDTGEGRAGWPAASAPYLSCAAGFAVGSSPWWLATTAGASTLGELGGSAIAGASPQGLLPSLALRLFGLLVLGTTVLIGLRPSWNAEWLALPLAPLALAIFMAALAWAAGQWRSRLEARLQLGLWITLCSLFVLTPFGNDPSGRYFLPLAPSLALFTAGVLDRLRTLHRPLAYIVAPALVTFHWWGTVQSALAFPPGVTTQFDAVAQVNQRDLPAVIAFLQGNGETRGYTNYWVSFPMAFLSDEALIYTAALPYHQDFRYTPRDNRYAPYRQMVAASQRVAYVTTRHPALNARLRERLTALGIAFREHSIGDFHIFYGLSRPVSPEALSVYATP